MLMSYFLDSHPMSVFISAFAAMGAFAPEANPSLQGRNLYLEDKSTMNKNIIRIIGKAATVAAASMRVRMNRTFIAPRSGMILFSISILWFRGKIVCTDVQWAG